MIYAPMGGIGGKEVRMGHGVSAGWPEHWLAGGSKEYLAVMEGPYNTQRADLGRPLLDDDGQLFYLDPARL